MILVNYPGSYRAFEEIIHLIPTESVEITGEGRRAATLHGAGFRVTWRLDDNGQISAICAIRYPSMVYAYIGIAGRDVTNDLDRTVLRALGNAFREGRGWMALQEGCY